jgi:hypothetical protein
MLRKILIGFSIFLLLLIAAGFFLFLKIQPSIRAAEARAGEEQKLLQPRLIRGEGSLDRRAFYTSQGLGNISQVRLGWPADREGTEIAVVGNQGADFVDLNGQIKKQVRFSIEQRCPVAVARINSTGEYGYLTRDESWAVPATLFDKDGRVLWRSEGTWPGVDDSTSGDVYGDGQLAVVIGYNGGGGLVLFDGKGKKLWKKDEANVWHVEMMDTNGDGHEEILHSDARGQLLVRNASGNVIAHYLPGFYVSQFALTSWGEEAQPSHILVPVTEGGQTFCKSVFVVLDAKGKNVAELDSPFGDVLKEIAATPVHFGNGIEYFAVLQSSSAKERAMLLLFDKDGQITYQEILAEPCFGIAAVPKKNAEQLLVGCADKIWAYSPPVQTNKVQKKISPDTVNNQ